MPISQNPRPAGAGDPVSGEAGAEPDALERLAARWEAEAARMDRAADAKRHATARVRGFAHAERYRECAKELRELIREAAS